MQTTCPVRSSQSLSFVSPSWIGSFKIPEKFSRATMKVLSEEIITDKARIEIISAIALQAYQHTTYPTSEEYNTMCRMLIER